MTTDLKNILANYTEAPPENNWERIEATIDEDGLFDSDGLYNFHQTPRSTIWDNIQSHLNEKSNGTAEVKQLHPGRNFYKYGIAAAILILLSVAAVNFFNARQPDLVANNDEVKTDIDSPMVDEPKDDSEIINNNWDITKPGAPVTTTINTSTKNIKNGNRYVTLANVDGKKIRLSKKAYTVFSCAENSTALNNVHCKESIQNVRKKMAASMLSSSGDFGGLMDLIKDLEENN